MKKSHEYDSPVLSRLVSVVTVLALCVCSVSCIVTASKVSTIATGGAVVNDGTNNPGTSNPGNNNPGTSNPGNNNPGTSNPGTNNPGTAEPGTDGGSEAPGTDAPSGPSNAEILAKYTEIMDQLKAGVATYDKKEYQILADDYDLGTIGDLILPIAQGLMTTEDEAALQNRDDMEQIPIIKNKKGCLLTDASKIKSASMTESGGKTTITIVLHDEKHPLPAEEGATSCDSAIGSMFNPLNQKDIDGIIADFSAVVTVKTFELTGKDCTATLVFDTATGKVESLKQVMNYYIDVETSVLGMGFLTVAGYATLSNDMTINNVTYK